MNCCMKEMSGNFKIYNYSYSSNIFLTHMFNKTFLKSNEKYRNTYYAKANFVTNVKRGLKITDFRI